jgi:hypothetical protein
MYCKVLEEIDYLKDLRIDDSIILKLILMKQDGKVWTGLIWFMIRDRDSAE